MLVKRGKGLVLHYIVSKIEKAAFLIPSKIIILRFIKTVYHICASIKQSHSGFQLSVLFAVVAEYNLVEKYLKAPVLLFWHIVSFKKYFFLHTHLFSCFLSKPTQQCLLYLNDHKNQLSSSSKYKFRGPSPGHFDSLVQYKA